MLMKNAHTCFTYQMTLHPVKLSVSDLGQSVIDCGNLGGFKRLIISSLAPFRGSSSHVILARDLRTPVSSVHLYPPRDSA
jgi:hypothetical protein